jgi:hypothetical protein
MYYLLTPNTWTASETEAEEMGGTLAIVRNATEQKWVFSTFGDLGGAGRNLWIGLHRTEPDGKFVWIDDSPLDYLHWYAGEPNNVGGVETCVHMRWDPAAPGSWNDLPDDSLLNGVVEAPEKANKNLPELEQTLVGDWYENGRIERLCHIAATDNNLFALNESNNASGRAFLTRKGFLYVAAWVVHGEIVDDRILWSNGTWWSRKPADYSAAAKSETRKVLRTDSTKSD